MRAGRERIEIFPGHWIEVTPKLKERAGIRPTARVVATLNNETSYAAAAVARDVRKTVKYSTLLLDEAVRLAKAKGMRYAVKKTGINRHSINLRARQVGAHKRNDIGSRYTMEQKRACVRLAQKLMASKEVKVIPFRVNGQLRQRPAPKWSHRGAFIEAGRRLGMNGRSIEWMWIQGTIPLAQQPSTA